MIAKIRERETTEFRASFWFNASEYDGHQIYECEYIPFICYIFFTIVPLYTYGFP